MFKSLRFLKRHVAMLTVSSKVSHKRRPREGAIAMRGERAVKNTDKSVVGYTWERGLNWIGVCRKWFLGPTPL
jgi:hypothetical protein